MSDDSYLEIYFMTNGKPVQLRRNRPDMIEARLQDTSKRFFDFQFFTLRLNGCYQFLDFIYKLAFV